MKPIKLHSFVIFSLLLFILFYSHADAQSAGTNQFGLRIGGFSGITFRHVNNNNVAVQADLLENYRGYWTLISAMAEKHIPLNEGFVLYFGGGIFLGGNRDPYYIKEDLHYWSPAFGLEGVFGADYYFEHVPLNLGLDVTPRFSFFYDPFPWDAAISLRYIF